MKINLFTRDGGFVRTEEIPQFDPPPEVITWGDRVFVRQLTSQMGVTGAVERRYTEGFAYPLGAAE